jgi:hypothetical protein
VDVTCLPEQSQSIGQPKSNSKRGCLHTVVASALPARCAVASCCALAAKSHGSEGVRKTFERSVDVFAPRLRGDALDKPLRT